MKPPDGHGASKRQGERTVHRPRPTPAVLALMLPFSLTAAEPASPDRTTPGASPPMSSSATPAHGAAGTPRAVAASIDAPHIAGRGLLRWFGLRVYEATLWIPASGFDPHDPLRSTFALDLRYERPIEGAAIADTSTREMARLGRGTPAQREKWGDALRRILPDVRAGDRLIGVHQPGRSVRFYRNDTLLGRVDDPDFGHAFFAIWLDPQTAAPELRNALLRDLAPSVRPAAEPRR